MSEKTTEPVFRRQWFDNGERAGRKKAWMKGSQTIYAGAVEGVLNALEWKLVKAQQDINALTSERDEAVRVAGELRAKAALLDDVIGHFKPYRVIPEYLHEKTYWQCGDCPCSAPTEAEIQHQANCCWARFDSLTTTGGSEPQKGITE